MRKLMTLAGVVCALSLSPAVARAEGWDDPRTMFTLGFAVGTANVADLEGTAFGLHVDAGRSFGRTHLQAEYGLYGITEGTAEVSTGRQGLMQRAGLGLRYHFGHLPFSRSMLGVIWAEGGIGREWYAWDGGGRLTRDDLSVGVGFGFVGNLGGYSGKAKYLGFHYLFRFSAAENPYADKIDAVACGGPCDEATEPLPYDLTFTFIMGFAFGR